MCAATYEVVSPQEIHAAKEQGLKDDERVLASTDDALGHGIQAIIFSTSGEHRTNDCWEHKGPYQ
jgi:hypothetical protein